MTATAEKIWIHYLQQGARLILLLCGGGKASQHKDIEQAKQIAADWKNHERVLR